MPGYSWTVHNPRAVYIDEDPDYMQATGIQAKGFNRISTLQVTRRKHNNEIEYEAKSSGFGKNAAWLATYTDTTVARTLRGLQSFYEKMETTYSDHAGALQMGRIDRKQQITGPR